MVKPGYKQTEIGVIPEDWDIKSLQDIVVSPLSYGVNAPAVPYDSNLYRYIRITDITEDGHYSKEDEVSVNILDGEKYCLCKGDILLARTGASTGKTYLYRTQDGKLVYAGFLIRASVDVDNYNPFYVFAQFHTKRYQDWVSTMSIRSGQPGINGKEYSSYLLPIPKIGEQKQIASALSDIDALITNLEKLIAKKKAIKQGAMQELLTGNKRLSGFIDPWAKHMVKDLGVFYSGLSGKGKSDFGCGTAHYITFLNVLTNTKININALERVRVSEGESQNTVKKGDLFFNTSSETPEEVGMCAALLDDVENTYLNSFCFGLRITNPEMYPLFLSYYFNSQEGRQIMKVLAQGATRYNLSKTNFSETIITVPDKEEQIAIAHLLLDMDVEIDTLFAKLEKTRNMKKGMMSELLTGRIRLV